MESEAFNIQKDVYLAHISGDREQTVAEHLAGTAELSALFARSFDAEPQGYFVGAAHDIGKRSSEFQKRLRGGVIVDHATAGAQECANLDALWAAGCVAGHHGGLPDFGNPRNDTPDEPTLFGRLRRKIPAYEALPLPRAEEPRGYGRDCLTDSFFIRMLYSCLVDADYLDTERFMSGGAAVRGTGEAPPALQEKLNRHIEENGLLKPESEVNRRRAEVLRACIDGGAQSKGLYTLTVPTGGGKTLASMAFALNHAVTHGMERVIYVIPYTSIIEQTAEVFRDIFGAENVIEHHANAVLEIDEHGDAAQYRLAKATENWDAPIIVTTAVQFFESLYANRPSKCRKLHSIANSVVIFDEAQMLPTAHLRPCVAAISAMVSHFGATAVLCTATQPGRNDLFRQYAPDHAIRELCPNTSALYEQLRRVTFVRVGVLDADALAERLAALPQVLCIVNTRKAAREVYEKLPKDGSYHLSTLMAPVHRRAVLAEVRERLDPKNRRPCRVVSTSLIEAGVDVDFPAVYREMAGLDSILQAAGRCNREGRHAPKESIVTIFEGLSKTPRLLEVNIGAAEETLRGDADPAAPETVERYFRAYRSLAGDKLDKAGVISAFEKGISGCMLPFRTVAEKFHLIDDAAKTVYVPLDDGEELVRCLRDGKRSRALFRKLGQYGVSVYERQYKALAARGALEPVDEDSAILLDTSLYDRFIGLELCENESTGFLAI